MSHSAKFWNLVDERRIQLKKIPFAKVPTALSSPPPTINVDHSFRHYGHFVSGQHCAGGKGDVLPRFGILENSPKRSSVSLILQPIVVWSHLSLGYLLICSYV